MSQSISIQVSTAPFASVNVKTVYGHDLSKLNEGDLRSILSRVSNDRAAVTKLDLGKVEKGTYQDREFKALDAAKVAVIDALDNLAKAK